MMWDGKVKGYVTGGADGDDVGRKGKRAWKWRGGVDKNETGWEEREGAHSPSVRSNALPIRLNWYYPYALLGDS